jgi:hypothetical protein
VDWCTEFKIHIQVNMSVVVLSSKVMKNSECVIARGEDLCRIPVKQEF